MADGPNTDLFPGGEAPDRAELIQYLVHTVGLPTDQARQIANRYQEPNKPGLSGGPDFEWTESRLKLWVEAQPEMHSAARTIGGGIATEAGVTPAQAARARQETFQDRFGRDQDERVQRAAQTADEATARAQGVRDRFYKAGYSVGFDAGPAMDPNALAQSLAIGVFTDAAGNVKYVDPADGVTPLSKAEGGVPTEVTPQTLWAAIKGQTFDMGTLRLPRAGRDPRSGARAGREGADDARLARIGRVAEERRSFITPSMAMAMLGSMDDDGVIKLQQQLWEAGLFGEVPPSWGVADETTRKAYMALFAEASLSPDEPIDRVLARLTDEAVTRGTSGGGQGDNAVPAFKPEIASKETLSQLVDTMAQKLTGAFVDDKTKNELIGQLQADETANQRAQYDRDVASATGGGTTPGGIDAFMAAISGQESGGNYQAQNPSGAYGKFQIMPANWGPWAERAGIGRNAPRTPENQEIVARHVMTEYYQRFGNWRDVAIAWFAGPGAVGNPSAERRSDGNMTVRQYADQAMAKMAQLGGAAGAGVAQAIETFDPQAEAEAQIKAQDPAAWEGHTFAQRAVDYFGLLQGVA